MASCDRVIRRHSLYSGHWGMKNFILYRGVALPQGSIHTKRVRLGLSEVAFICRGCVLTSGVAFICRGGVLTSGVAFICRGCVLTSGVAFICRGCVLTSGVAFMKGSLNAVDWNLKNTIRHFPKFIANTGLTSKDEKLVKK